MAIVILLRGEQAQLSAGLIHGLLGPMSFRLARPGGQQQQVFFSRARALPYAGHGTGIVPLQPLGIVEDAQAALAPVSFQLIALLAAQRAGLRNMDRHQRKAVRRQVGDQVFHRMHRRQAAVRLVAAVAAHGFGVAEARKGRRNREPGHLADPLHQRLDDLEDLLFLRKGHLQIDLCELRLPVGAQVFVAEAAHDLKILVEAADHQQLLEDLRRLRQGVEVARLNAAGHQVVARAFRSRSRHKRRLDLEEAFRVERLPHGKRDLRAQHDVALHARPAQVHVAILEASVFTDVDRIFHGERRSPRFVENPNPVGDHLHFAGGNIRVHRLRRAQGHAPFDRHHVLRAEQLGFLVDGGV